MFHRQLPLPMPCSCFSRITAGTDYIFTQYFFVKKYWGQRIIRNSLNSLSAPRVQGESLQVLGKFISHYRMHIGINHISEYGHGFAFYE